MNAVINLDVPEFQIGQPVTVYFKDSMQKHGVCEADRIVRCKDCWKHDYDNCPFYESFDFHPHGDWFCADGESDVKKP